MKNYVATIVQSGCVVSVLEDSGRVTPLSPRCDVRNHSPTGFAWGYHGSGPAQLALALCIDVLDGDIDRALRVYHAFKFLEIAKHPSGSQWSMTHAEALGVIASIELSQAERASAPIGAQPF